VDQHAVAIRLDLRAGLADDGAVDPDRAGLDEGVAAPA
jgi:hypothetical protein